VNIDNTIRIWNASNSRILAENTEHSLLTEIMAWNSDSSKIAIADHVDTIQIWGAESKRITATLKGSPDITQIVWQPEGKLLAMLSYVTATGLGGEHNVIVRIFDTESSRLVASIPFPDQTNIASLQWTRNGQRLLIATYAGNVSYWDTDEQKTIPLLDLQKATDRPLVIQQIISSPDDTKLLILGYVCCVGPSPSVWDAKTGTRFTTLEWDIHFDLRNGGIFTWSLTNDKIYRTTWRTPDSYSGDGGSAYPVLDPDRFNVWIQLVYRSDGSTEEPPMIVLHHSNWVTSVDLGPALTRVATLSADKYLRIWKANNGKLERSFSNVGRYSWSPNDRFLAISKNNPLVEVLDMSTGKTIASVRDKNGFLSWSPDSRFLAIWHNDDPIDVVDVSTGRVIATLPSLGGSIMWSPNSTKLTQFSDGQLIIWAKN
jgi:WD40 repeat protein